MADLNVITPYAANELGGPWVPIAYGGHREVDGLWIGFEYRGGPVANRQEAWAAARGMCEQLSDGAGFSVKRARDLAAQLTDDASEVQHG